MAPGSSDTPGKGFSGSDVNVASGAEAVPSERPVWSPGSAGATTAGCICAVMDNGYGRGSGYVDAFGAPTFWVTDGCPLHAPTSAPPTPEASND